MSQPNNTKPTKDGKEPKFNVYWIYGLLIVAIIALQIFSSQMQEGVQDFTWERFENMVKEGDIKDLRIINEKQAFVTIKGNRLEKDEYKDANRNKFRTDASHYQFNTGPIEVFAQKLDVLNAEIDDPSSQVQPIYEERTDWLGPLLGWLLPIGLIIFLWLFIMKRMSGGAGGPGGQIFNIGKSKATLFDKNTKVNVTFKDVAGLDEAKVEVMEIVDFLKQPKKYTSLGGKIPKGVLLVGPPGTGKTFLQRQWLEKQKCHSFLCRVLIL